MQTEWLALPHRLQVLARAGAHMQRRHCRAPGAVLADNLLAHNRAPVVSAGAASSARAHLHTPHMSLSHASCTGPQALHLTAANNTN